jgi:hypothetical protein
MLRGWVAVRDINGLNALLVALNGAVVRVLHPDAGLVIGPRDALTQRIHGITGQLLRHDVLRIDLLDLGLGNAPVLAVLALEITSNRAYRVRVAARVKVIQRLLLDGVAGLRGHGTVYQREYPAVDVFPGTAVAELSRRDDAPVRTDVTLCLAVF